MNRKVFVIASFGITAVMILLSGSAFSGPDAANSLPEVEYLGEGPETFNTTLADFIVKRGQEQYDFVAGPTYEATEGERVWAVRGTKEAPNVINNSVANLGMAYENCTVEYVGIDDDENGIRNGFFVGSSLVELIIEGMVFEGSYVVPFTTPDHRLVAEESIAYWYTPCEEGSEPSETPTEEPEPTNTPTKEPEPGEEDILLLPIIFSPGGDQPPPTSTPTGTLPPPTLTPTSTLQPPTSTPTATAEPKSYTVACGQDYDISIVDEEIHFQFQATAYENGMSLEDVELKGTLDVGSQTPSNIEETNPNGVADFFITVLVTSIEQAPVATVAFNDQATYGDATCDIDFSVEQPTPTPTPPPAPDDFDLVCHPDYDIRIGIADVEFEFSATAFYKGYPLPEVKLEAILDAGGERKDQIEETDTNGVADFKIEILLDDIKFTPIAGIEFEDQEEYGNSYCQIKFSHGPLLAMLAKR
jgi:hypothetical protein